MAKHRILIDGYYLGKPSGYGRFIAELLRSLGTSQAPFDFFVAVPDFVEEHHLTPYPGITYLRLTARIFPLWEQLMIPACARRHSCTIIHSPFNTRAIWSRGANMVTTVHDLTFLNPHTGRDFKSALIHLYMAATFFGGTARSKQVVAVSDTTKKALAQRNISSRRIYNSVDGFISIPVHASPTNHGRPYFLHRGSYAPGHRNTERIIAAFLSRPKLSETYDLKILGVPHGIDVWKTAGMPCVQYLDRLSDQDLAALYAGSAGVVAVSLLEGFCLPIVEAFGFKVPVITSNIDPMKEIAQDAALIVSPDDADAIADAMEQISSNPELAAALIVKGRERLREFSSDKMATQLIDTYHHLLDKKGY